jgi:hypothetical protein
MTEKEICKICDNYDVDTKCDFKDKCKLIALVRENRKLKTELKAVKKELTELKSIRSWELYPDRMGK